MHATLIVYSCLRAACFRGYSLLWLNQVPCQLPVCKLTLEVTKSHMLIVAVALDLFGQYCGTFFADLPGWVFVLFHSLILKRALIFLL